MFELVQVGVLVYFHSCVAVVLTEVVLIVVLVLVLVFDFCRAVDVRVDSHLFVLVSTPCEEMSEEVFCQNLSRVICQVLGEFIWAEDCVGD